MEIDLTENMIVSLYESLLNKIVRELSKEYNKKENLIKVMLIMATNNGYNMVLR